MPKPFVPVDEQITEFENGFRTYLDQNLWDAIDLNYWIGLDSLDRDSLERIYQVIDVPFQRLLTPYRGTAVEAILTRGKALLKSAARVALNVPFPMQDGFMAAVIENLFDFYVEHIYARLRTEMVMVNHSAQVIQRNWIRAMTDPTRPICISRIEREYSEFATLLESIVVE